MTDDAVLIEPYASRMVELILATGKRRFYLELRTLPRRHRRLLVQWANAAGSASDVGQARQIVKMLESGRGHGSRTINPHKPDRPPTEHETYAELRGRLREMLRADPCIENAHVGEHLGMCNMKPPYPSKGTVLEFFDALPSGMHRELLEELETCPGDAPDT